MQTLQTKLKELREEKRLTQKQISEILGMKQQTYQKIESGTASDIKISTLYHICKTLNVSANWLIGLEEEKTQ